MKIGKNSEYKQRKEKIFRSMPCLKRVKTKIKMKIGQEKEVEEKREAWKHGGAENEKPVDL